MNFIDSNSHHYCVIDPSSSVSLFPTNPKKHEIQSHISVCTTNSVLPTFGTSAKTIKIGSLQITWNFILVNTDTIILGRDFIQHFSTTY